MSACIITTYSTAPDGYGRLLLAAQYGVKVTTIKDIVARKIWKHI